LTRTPKSSDFIDYRGRVYRLVEAQHRISTSRLAGSILDEERLERLVEAVKPPLPREARKLHHLLATPFRYGHRSESRFRKAGERPGIFYASEAAITCLCEMAYWRLRFYAAAPSASFPVTTTEHLMFSVALGAKRALDLTRAPFDAGRAKWTDADDYGPCQRFAGLARKVDAQLIRYESARDPKDGRNVAVLRADCFESSVPNGEGTWHFRFQGGRLNAIAASPSNERHEFEFGQFGLDR
jgi:RES domain-containing protein